ncbi:putative transcription factor interactor and regulator CCHC(Zn) family [Helianthus annuus]|uniref:Transcription factor interactor and regulator CCHC(Zn) family n=2 Tax=Helianthus annuus TaxID=4232 RepID=A0A9K3HAZ6_HELAN|nr:putative transcription factor interactor and regulator CCHC(Zn) family [Helianthus annuus]KAJ0475588.1 putative transcription factor interactor and regulator CCHC(Zn) family [Helianthus annuus]KAJ0479495.1 putative transcription factor interactor and regulator CCHC(Zn) family [Helianthus annuus]
MLTNPRWFKNLELKHVSHTLNHTHVARIVSSVKDLDVVVRFFYWITKTYSYKHDLNCYKAMLNRLVRERRPRLGDTDQIRVLMVKECTTEGQLMQVVYYFNEIRGKGVGYSLYSCNALLIQMGKFRMVEAARDVFGKMLGYGIKPSLLKFNTMINMLCKRGMVREAKSLSDQMGEYDLCPDLIWSRCMFWIWWRIRVSDLRLVFTKFSSAWSAAVCSMNPKDNVPKDDRGKPPLPVKSSDAENPSKDNGLEDLGFMSFSEKMYGDVFISSKPVGVQELRDKASMFAKPLNIDGNPMLPRHGMVRNEQRVINIIDELEKVTVPVQTPTEKANCQADPSVNVTKPVSYADKLQSSGGVKRVVNFRLVEAQEVMENADIVIPKEAVQKVQDRFTNVLYGYFLGSRLPFPVVEYYAKNVWNKYGFSKAMMNSNGFFFFKFDSSEGMNKVLEGGPWLIRKVPLFLNVWTPAVTLRKDGIKSVPVWVKFHNVPIAVYTDDGLSLLASKIGIPKRLDNYTADMCIDNWGRSSFARAMVEISADKELKDHIVVAVPKLVEEGYVLEEVKVEYEWRPKRCPTCCLFGHDVSSCPKSQPELQKKVSIDQDGFVTDKRKTAKHVFPQKKQKAKFVYKQKTNPSGAGMNKGFNGGNGTPGASTSGTKKDDEIINKGGTSTGVNGGNGKNNSNIKVQNSFEALSSADKVEGVPVVDLSYVNEPIRSLYDEEGVIDDLHTEMSEFMAADTQSKPAEGASTPGLKGVNG